ncbi:PaaI family thioesterase [Nocardia seriolae]|uniref:Acyl-CoA thioesterase-like N-terminal HotDog domain-containing protein n=1 Tax=Nocardia seriolae TaxID=37332 RepID=A0A0B8NA21_9NOCA|nr:hotdog domain-containing protein [Nocardia seriolae]APA98080.1 hypothetical protein NS506_04032 [Nocardia seriolae]MTJ62777.1 hypothetical protein [Nocardia seriolae]MTJ73885.1 hypothetical protein [Nocardia seriolae]MTJ87810.1 hypothetical protein [Nocardia seriolae]MTK40711.1 hypothetical protein [Nocardia seriolae]
MTSSTTSSAISPAAQPPRTVAAPDPIARAAEVSVFPTLPTERRFHITAPATAEGRVHARQLLPLETARTGTHLAGSLGPLVDFALGRATQTVLSPTVAIRTATLRLDLLSAATAPGATVDAHASIVDFDDHTVYGEALITTSDGRPIARASTRMLIVAGEIAPTDPGTAITPVHPPTSLTDLLAARTQPATTDSLTAPTAAWMANPWGIAHGGIPVAVAGLALEQATRLAAGPAAVLDPTITYHRPLTLDAPDIRATTRIDRLGARTIATTTTVYQQDPDRPAATATAALLRHAGRK